MCRQFTQFNLKSNGLHKNELALIDLISNLNKEFYYFGEEGDLIPSPRWEIRETVDKFVSQFMQSIESERDFLDD